MDEDMQLYVFRERDRLSNTSRRSSAGSVPPNDSRASSVATSGSPVHRRPRSGTLRLQALAKKPHYSKTSVECERIAFSPSSASSLQQDKLLRRTTPSPIIQRTTPSPATQRTTPSPIIQRTTPSPIIHRTTPSHVTQRTTPSPVTQRTTPSPVTQRTTPSPVAQRTTPSPVAQRISPFKQSPTATKHVASAKATRPPTPPGGQGTSFVAVQRREPPPSPLSLSPSATVVVTQTRRLSRDGDRGFSSTSREPKIIGFEDDCRTTLEPHGLPANPAKNSNAGNLVGRRRSTPEPVTSPADPLISNPRSNSSPSITPNRIINFSPELKSNVIFRSRTSPSPRRYPTTAITPDDILTSVITNDQSSQKSDKIAKLLTSSTSDRSLTSSSMDPNISCLRCSPITTTTPTPSPSPICRYTTNTPVSSDSAPIQTTSDSSLIYGPLGSSRTSGILSVRSSFTEVRRRSSGVLAPSLAAINPLASSGARPTVGNPPSSATPAANHTPSTPIPLPQTTGGSDGIASSSVSNTSNSTLTSTPPAPLVTPISTDYGTLKFVDTVNAALLKSSPKRRRGVVKPADIQTTPPSYDGPPYSGLKYIGVADNAKNSVTLYKSPPRLVRSNSSYQPARVPIQVCIAFTISSLHIVYITYSI